ncbi:hypothetical protein Hanom_Chr14g01248991 [Helianthus anomalus]
MVSKRKEGRPHMTLEPSDLRRRWWLNSVLTKVIRKPLEWRILASFSIGLICPCAGKDMTNACGCFWLEPMEPLSPSSLPINININEIQHLVDGYTYNF